MAYAMRAHGSVVERVPDNVGDDGLPFEGKIDN